MLTSLPFQIGSNFMDKPFLLNPFKGNASPLFYYAYPHNQSQKVGGLTTHMTTVFVLPGFVQL